MGYATATFEATIICPIHSWGHTGLSIKRAINFCDAKRNDARTPSKHRLLYDFCIKVLESMESNNGRLISASYILGAIVFIVNFSSREDMTKFTNYVEQTCKENSTLQKLLKAKHICIKI